MTEKCLTPSSPFPRPIRYSHARSVPRTSLPTAVHGREVCDAVIASSTPRGGFARDRLANRCRPPVWFGRSQSSSAASDRYCETLVRDSTRQVSFRKGLLLTV